MNFDPIGAAVLMLHQPSLSISVGQATSCGPKACNDDFYGALLPEGRERSLKGCVFAIADGISSSQYSRAAAETCVKTLLSDYMATPETWRAKTAGQKVIRAINAWLHAQTNFAGVQDPDYGYTSTLTALIAKGHRAHIFHVGDSAVWRVSGQSLEPLTVAHHARLDGGRPALARAMGAAHGVDIDYRAELLHVGDVFLLTTDGLHEAWQPDEVIAALQSAPDLDAAAQRIIAEALPRSDDNLTLQILRVDALPLAPAADLERRAALLPGVTDPKPGDALDGYQLQREVHSNHRSRIFKAVDPSGKPVAVKLPAVEIRDDPAAISRFVAEEWIARRVSHPHLLSAPQGLEERSALYTVTAFLPGQTLRQWMYDTPNPSLAQVRDIVEQIIAGARALHRREMLHQDLRPENVMISPDGHVTLIDFGAAYISGVQETNPADQPAEILGTLQYTAPEYFAGEAVSWRSDAFSIGVIAYEMLTGQLPYGTAVSQVRAPRDRRNLRYRPVGEDLPAWLDHALSRVLHPDPAKRPASLSEFAADLRRPSLSFARTQRAPLMVRHPVPFWQGIAAFFAALALYLFVKLNA